LNNLLSNHSFNFNSYSILYLALSSLSHTFPSPVNNNNTQTHPHPNTQALARSTSGESNDGIRSETADGRNSNNNNNNNNSGGGFSRGGWSKMKSPATLMKNAFSSSTKYARSFTSSRATHGDDGISADEEEAYISSTTAPKYPLMRVFNYLYGEMEIEEIYRIVTLSATLFFMIGGYWLLRSLKDPVMAALCGVENIPRAKMLSVVVVLGVVFVYNKLIDMYPKHKLFYLFGTFYFIIFTVIAFLLSTDEIGLKNEVASSDRILGWVVYCSIESFGSVMVALFWSFVNSSVTLESAKSAYGFMVAAAQIGSILGPTVVTYADVIGIPCCFFIGALCMLALQFTMYVYIKKYGAVSTKELEEQSEANAGKSSKNKKKKKGAGVMEGLHLFMKHDYIKGIFAVSVLFMIEVTIIDYTMKVLAKEHYDALYSGLPDSQARSSEAFASFMGLFGQCTNTLSFFFSLLGTSAVIRTLGLRSTLLLFPSLCLIVILWVRMLPDLWNVFGAMMLLKGFSYALNNPTKEILYQPTSSAVKFKSKSWIDIFGDRGSKALGSIVTNAFSDNAAELVANGSLVGICVASFLIFNARYMGRKFDEYTESGYIVGVTGVEDEEDDDEDEKGLEMSENDNDDTSCGILEEGQGPMGNNNGDDDDDEDDDEDDEEKGDAAEEENDDKSEDLKV
jgi:AAA family ATP:ADP antiporter